ncbi:hypothetical protein BGX23_006072 [Mortierella sp. AD031]|nr:hypothetical protein BGX23_006072 [Mortierella sp. AD031]
MSSTTVPSNNNNNNNNEAGNGNNNNNEAGNGNNNINNNAVAVSAPAPATVSFDDYDQIDLTGKALEMSATAYYAYDAPPLFVAQPGDPDLDHEPEEEEQDKAAVDQLAGGLNNLELPTPPQ